LRARAVALAALAWAVAACGEPASAPADSEAKGATPEIAIVADTTAPEVSPLDVVDADRADDMAQDATQADLSGDVTLADLAETTPATDAEVVDVSADATPTSGGDYAVWLGGMTDLGETIVPWTEPAQPVTLIFGPQGGYHLWAAVCIQGTTQTKGVVDLSATLVSNGAGVLPGKVHVNTAFKPAATMPGWACRTALPDFVTCACQVSGHAIRIRAEITNAQGNKAWTERIVTPTHKEGPCSDEPQCAGQGG